MLIFGHIQLNKLFSFINMKNLFAIAAISVCFAGAVQEISAANPLDALGGLVSSLTSTSKFEVSDLKGTWSYQSPAVSFKSENTLNKIGGVAASATIENQIRPYYERLGLNTLTLTVDADANFAMKIKGVTLKGTIAKESDEGALTFSFNALGKKSLGKISAQATKSATNELSLTFDVSRAIAIADKVASVAKMESLQTVTNILKSYDGIYAGAKLKKTDNGTTATSGNGSTATSGSSTDKDSGTSKAADVLQGLLGGKKDK